MLNVWQLEVFVTVVEQRGLTRAANHLQCTQPAVSAQLRQLRSFVGAPILVRDGARVAPTEPGRALYSYGKAVLQATETLQRDLREINSGELDHIVVGASRAYSGTVLPALLSTFQRSHRTLTLSLIERSSQELVERVEAGSVDTALVRPEQVPQGLVAALDMQHLGHDRIVVIESPRHPFTHGRSLQLQDLVNVPFVRVPIEGQRIGTSLLAHLAGAGLRPYPIVMELETWEAIKEAVRAGVGLAAAPESVVRRELRSGELHTVTVEGFEETRSIALIVSPHRRRVGASRVFQELVRFLTTKFPIALAA